MVLNNVNIYNFEMPKLAVQYACIHNYLVGAGTLVCAHEREGAFSWWGDAGQFKALRRCPIARTKVRLSQPFSFFSELRCMILLQTGSMSPCRWGELCRTEVDPCTRQARFQVSGIPTTCTIGRQATMEPHELRSEV